MWHWTHEWEVKCNHIVLIAMVVSQQFPQHHAVKSKRESFRVITTTSIIKSLESIFSSSTIVCNVRMRNKVIGDRHVSLRTKSVTQNETIESCVQSRVMNKCFNWMENVL